MLAKNNHTIAMRPQQDILPFRVRRRAMRNNKANRLSNCTTAEAIELLERSGNDANHSIHLPFALLLAASVIMLFVTMSILLIQLPGILEPHIQFHFQDLVRATAGR